MATFTEALNELKQLYRDDPDDSEEMAKHIRCAGAVSGFLTLDVEIGVHGSTEPGVFTVYLDLLPDEESEHTKISTLNFSLFGLDVDLSESLSEEQICDVMESLGLLSAEWEMSE